MAENFSGLSTHALLAEYTWLLNKHGQDAPEPALFLDLHKDNDELQNLAETARWLKKGIVDVQDYLRKEGDEFVVR